MELQKLSKQELFEICKSRGLNKYKYLSKKELIEMINASSPSSDVVATNNLTFIEVCAGGGGLSSGLMKSGFTPLLLNDNNKDCCKTLRKNHPEANVVCGSMSDIDFTPFIGKVDLLTGGVPCQKSRSTTRIR